MRRHDHPARFRPSGRESVNDSVTDERKHGRLLGASSSARTSVELIISSSSRGEARRRHRDATSITSIGSIDLSRAAVRRESRQIGRSILQKSRLRRCHENVAALPFHHPSATLTRRFCPQVAQMSQRSRPLTKRFTLVVEVTGLPSLVIDKSPSSRRAPRCARRCHSVASTFRCGSSFFRE